MSWLNPALLNTCGSLRVLETHAAESVEGVMSAGKSWFERLWSKDKVKRRAERKAGPPLIAHYWTGAAPAGQGIQDISATGLYLQTEQRWYPGTIVKIVLQRTNTDDSEEGTEDSISVQAKAVRMDSNGVGFAFVLEKAQPVRPGQSRLDVVADQKALDEFLLRLHESMGSLRLEVR